MSCPLCVLNWQKPGLGMYEKDRNYSPPSFSSQIVAAIVSVANVLMPPNLRRFHMVPYSTTENCFQLVSNQSCGSR